MLVGCQKKKPLKDEPLKLTMCISDPKKVAHYCNFKRYSSGKKRKVTSKKLQITRHLFG